MSDGDNAAHVCLYALGASRVIDYHGLRSAYDALPDASVDVIWDNYGYVRRPP